ncbi:MAG: glycosyltransferase, partial [Nanoarchaeota archaeon]|nr:glycosyltransferase [Nanoarchaeota archaeon]
MKKITILYELLKELGGLERVMFFQANCLREKNYVDLGFGFVSKEWKKISEELGLNTQIKIFQIGKSKNEFIQLVNYLLFPGVSKKVDTDLIISHSFMSSKIAFNRKKKFGTPYVVMMHHPPQLLYGRKIGWINNISRLSAYILGMFFGNFLKKSDKKAVEEADKVIVNSKYTGNRIREIYGVDFQVIYPAISSEFKMVDNERVKEKLEKMNLKNEFILLHGRMIKDKRPDLAVKAYANSVKNGCKHDLVISGTVEEAERIKKLSKLLGIEKSVKILGRVSRDELVALYNGASCFLMSAPKEDFGLTPIEAMACGCPVIAWRDGAGPEETIIESENGFLAKPYDFRDFSKAIDVAIAKKWKKEKISNSMKKFSEKNS